MNTPTPLHADHIRTIAHRLLATAYMQGRKRGLQMVYFLVRTSHLIEALGFEPEVRITPDVVADLNRQLIELGWSISEFAPGQSWVVRQTPRDLTKALYIRVPPSIQELSVDALRELIPIPATPVYRRYHPSEAREES